MKQPHTRYIEISDQTPSAKTKAAQPKRGISFAEMLSQADAVHDQVWLSPKAQGNGGGYYPVIGSIQSALASVLQPVPWIGLRVASEKKPRRQ